jgi:ribosomal protein S27E
MKISCPECNGECVVAASYGNGIAYVDCPTCKGTGTVEQEGGES